MSEGLKRIDPFKGIDAAPITRRITKELRWLNFFGDNKTCKTTFCTSLQERLRCVHLDLDFLGGAKQQIGTFLTCQNLSDYTAAYRLMRDNLDTIRPQVIIIDTLTVLYDWLEEKFMQEEGLKVIEWKNWGPMRERLMNAIRKIQSLCPLLITVHSFRISAMGKDDNKVTFMDTDIPQKIQKYLQGAADASLHFYWETSESGDAHPVFSVKNTGLTDVSVAGSRDENLYGLHTLDELRDYIFKQFGVDDASLSEAA